MSKKSNAVKLPPTWHALVQGTVVFVLFYFISCIILLFHYESEWWVNITAILTLVIYVLTALDYDKIKGIGYVVVCSIALYFQFYVYPDKIMAILPPSVETYVEVSALKQRLHPAVLYFYDVKLYDHYPNYFLAELDEHPEADKKYTGEYIVPIVQKNYMEGDSIFVWAVGCNLEESSYKMSFKDDSLFHLSLEQAPMSGITLLRDGKEYKRYLPFVKSTIESNHLKTAKDPTLVWLSGNPKALADENRNYFFYIPVVFIFSWTVFIFLTYIARRRVLIT